MGKFDEQKGFIASSFSEVIDNMYVLYNKQFGGNISKGSYSGSNIAKHHYVVADNLSRIETTLEAIPNYIKQKIKDDNDTKYLAKSSTRIGYENSMSNLIKLGFFKDYKISMKLDDDKIPVGSVGIALSGVSTTPIIKDTILQNFLGIFNPSNIYYTEPDVLSYSKEISTPKGKFTQVVAYNELKNIPITLEIIFETKSDYILATGLDKVREIVYNNFNNKLGLSSISLLSLLEGLRGFDYLNLIAKIKEDDTILGDSINGYVLKGRFYEKYTTTLNDIIAREKE
jgi:hypothetical protein